ncbi:MAG: DMT family transporter [Candidatus Saccharimonadales bacterium]
MKNRSSLPIVIAVLQTFQFASMGIWVRMMEGSFTTYQQVYIRVLLAALLGWIFFHRSISFRKIISYSRYDLFIYFLRATMAFGVGVLFFTFSIQHTQYATVSFVASLPVLGVLAWFMYKERLAKGTVKYILLSVVGLVLLTKISFSNLKIGTGEIAAIVSMVGFNLGYLLSRKHPKSSNKYQDAVIVLGFGWIVPFVALLLTEESIVPGHITMVAWIGLVASVITNIVGMVMINYVFANMKAYVAGNIFLLEGVFALVIGRALYNEVPGARELFGAAVILTCAYIVAQKDRKGQTVAGED